MSDDEPLVATRRSASVPIPLRTKGRISAVHLRDAWFVACASSELRRKPLARTIQGVPLVLFRDHQGRAGALLDRCPHRNVPLSIGEVAKDGTLQCAYHGWRFDREGACRAIPALVGEPGQRGRRAPRFAVEERQGFVFVWATPDANPTREPHHFAYADAPGYTTVRQTVVARATLWSTIENALDVPHTAFLHRGLFRSSSRGIEIVAKVRRTADRVEAEYLGEPRPPGLVARILSPSGGLVTHFDRFLLPSIAQVEYRIGDENHLLVDAAMTPVDELETVIHAVVSFKLRIPGAAIAPFVKPLALRIFGQDATILERQTEVLERFGGEQFVSTEIDVLGRHVLRLLRAAERGEPAEPEEAEVRLVV